MSRKLVDVLFLKFLVKDLYEIWISEFLVKKLKALIGPVWKELCGACKLRCYFYLFNSRKNTFLFVLKVCTLPAFEPLDTPFLKKRILKVGM